MVNIKAKVISLPDEHGTDVFAAYLTQLGVSAKISHDERVKLAYIVKAINFMQYVDFSNLPTHTDSFYHTLEIEVDGITYKRSFWLIKALHKPDIYELRLNIPSLGSWRFRATFFPYVHSNSVKYHCFVFPFEKFPHLPDPTNYYRDKTFNILYDVQHNPSDYASYFV